MAIGKILQKTVNMIRGYLNKLLEISSYIKEKELSKAINIIHKTIKKKNTIFICGNGGSGSIASHALCDWMKRLAPYAKCKMYDLTSNKSLISAISNDISYDNIFVHQLEILSKTGDIFIAISSSGNSKNIIKALNYTKKNKIKSISILGFNGGKAKKLSDVSIHFKTEKYEHHEDIAQIIMHNIFLSLKERFKD